MGAASPGQARADYARALASLSRGDPAGARPALERAAAILVDDDAVQANLALCLVQCGDPGAALACSDAAIRRAPGYFGHHYGRGLALLGLNEFAAAIDSLEHAAHIDARQARAWLLLGQACHALGRHADADRAFASAIALEPDNGFLHLCQATLHQDEGNFDLALGYSRRALALLPDFAGAWVTASAVQRGLGHLDVALDCARRAVQRAPRDADALRALGLALQSLGRLEEAAAVFLDATTLRHAPGNGADLRRRELRQSSRPKLRHDIEQFHHLARSRPGKGFDDLARAHEEMLAALPGDPGDRAFHDLPHSLLQSHGSRYNRLHHLEPADRLAQGALDPTLDAAAIEADYFGRGPGITWIDGLLRPEALAALRDYCLRSTLWFDFHHSNGYLGASLANGFAAPLLLQIAEELRTLLPNIFRDHALTQLWAFKYDSQLQGIQLHADIAAVNLNFWITPDDANLDPEHGGLVVWDKEAPPEWGFDEYNASSPAGQARIESFLRDSGATCVRVPYRQNRAVMFNSDLFHATDTIRFREGYENRRINITMLFGLREGAVR